MKILVEQDNGKLVELREVEGIDNQSNLIIALCRVYLKDEDRIRIEHELNKSTGKRFVLLPPYIEKIVGVQSGAE